MQWFRQQPIQRKITFVVLLSCLTALLLASGLMLGYQLHQVRAMFVEDVVSTGQLLANASVTAMDSTNEVIAQQLFTSLKAKDQIQSAALQLKATGSFLVLYGDPTLPSRVASFPIRNTHEVSGTMIKLAQTVERPGAELGTLYLEASFGHEVNQVVWNYTSALAATIGLSGFVAVLLSGRLQQSVTSPILRLAHTAWLVAEMRDYSVRAEKTTDDELGLFTDAFNQMLAEIQSQDAALKKSQEHYQVAVTGSDDGLWDWDLQTGTYFLNPRSKAMLGYSETELQPTYEQWKGLIHLEDRARAVQAFDDHLARRTPKLHMEMRMIHRNGNAVWILSRGTATFGVDDGKPLRMAGTHTDISDRKAAEENLRLFNRLVDSASNGLVICDPSKPDNPIIYCNRSFLNMTGYEAKEVVGRNCRFLQGKMTQQPELEEIRRGIREQVEVRVVLKNFRKDGTLFHNELVVAPVRDEQNRVTHFVGIQNDITRRREADEELSRLNQELIKTSRQAGMAEVATGVLHNVGNVLNSVNVSAGIVMERLRASKISNLNKAMAMVAENRDNLVDYLTENPKGKMLPSYLSTVSEHLEQERVQQMEEITQLSKNIEHIKQIVAMQQNYAKVSGVLEPVDPSVLVEDALRLVNSAFERHRVTLSRDFQSTSEVLVDRHKVLQILVNLLNNAKQALDHYRETGREVRIQIHQPSPGRVRISVQDNGGGISRENLARIFQHGFTTKKDGHGFGLHSGANAAREMDGALTVHSEGPGLGATFILELPTAESQLRKQAA